MKTRSLFLAGLMFCASILDAEACKKRSSSLGDFARFPIGMPLKALPAGVKRLPNCAIYREYHTFDCAFVDSEGSEFLASGKAIARVDRDLHSSSILPQGYPLKPGMSMKDAAEVLAAANPTMKLLVDHKGKGGSVFAPECLKNRFATYYLDLKFDKAGGLKHLTAGYDTPEN